MENCIANVSASPLRRFLKYAKKHERVWFARRIDIAKHWIKNNPPQNQEYLASQLSASEFSQSFGDVIKNAPWIADRVFYSELSPAHNSLKGLQSAFRVQLNLAHEDERIEVIRRSVNIETLRGPLTVQKNDPSALSRKNTSNLCADAKSSELKRSNNMYENRFGFPFLMVCDGLTDNQILTALKMRMNNDRNTEIQSLGGARVYWV
ncbi:MAG: hypothetical protein CBB68_09040 [Rhodospirillaceae bacterium TMED8]|nr:hypothetical protein [Magnetovibrio sp.]OUT50504.1 MAG: hypothetical protein CBB68_09040 [Rhodospirillaceae bacterium TMED8]